MDESDFFSLVFFLTGNVSSIKCTRWNYQWFVLPALFLYRRL